MSDPQTNSAADRPSALGIDLHVDLTGPGRRAGLTNALREAVRSGRLAPGTRLPPSRSLAADLGIARHTVTETYTDLVAEGWLIARQGSGTRVGKRIEPRKATRTAPRARPAWRGPTYGMLPGSPDLAEFPRAQWLTAARRALLTAPNEAFGIGDAMGRVELRNALADYLSRARGVYAEPERVVICSGFRHGLLLMTQALKARRVRTVAVESYSLDIHRDLLTSEGIGIPPLYVDERGARVDDLTRMDGVGAVLLTPAHQYPTGVALHPDRRAAVVDWARAAGGLILEDDYDGEFRYDRQPVGALQGLDPERVVYLGTVGKALAPGLRLGWMVLPEDLVPEIVAAKGNADWVSSTFDQLTLAEFITSGAYDRHIRSMRIRYRRRRDELVATLAQRAPGIHLTGLAAGLQAVLQLPRGTEAAVAQEAARQGLAVSRLAEFRHEVAESGWRLPEQDGLVVNYAAPSDSAWAGTLDTLCRVMPQPVPGPR